MDPSIHIPRGPAWPVMGITLPYLYCVFYTIKRERIQHLNSIVLLISQILVFQLILICKFQNISSALSFEVKHSKFFCRSFRTYRESFIIRRGNRRLSLAALPDLPAASRGVKLPLLAGTRSVFQSM